MNDGEAAGTLGQMNSPETLLFKFLDLFTAFFVTGLVSLVVISLFIDSGIYVLNNIHAIKALEHLVAVMGHINVSRRDCFNAMGGLANLQAMTLLRYLCDVDVADVL